MFDLLKNEPIALCFDADFRFLKQLENCIESIIKRYDLAVLFLNFSFVFQRKILF